MPDAQIHPTGTVSTPADYAIPPSAELLLKSVYAKYDGSAAASSFVPLVRIISDAGSITDEIPQDVTIAAGGSADATWFPRVGAAAGTTPPPSSPVVMPYATVDLPTWTWPQGDTFVNFTGATVHVTDSTVFTNYVATDGSTPILINKAGIYLAWGAIGPWNPAWGTSGRATSLGPTVAGFNINDLTTSFPLTYTPLGGQPYQLGLSAGGFLPTDPVVAGELRLEVNQTTGANRTVGAYLAILRLTGNGAGH